jgi:hypothetical protein
MLALQRPRRGVRLGSGPVVLASAFVFACLAFLTGVVATPGCFAPREPPCAFTCVSAGARCPDGFTCGSDGLCHRDGAEGMCLLTPPEAGAGPDADADTNLDADAGSSTD